MNVVMVLSVITAILLILLILVQKGRGGGLSGAFGGGAASGIMGSKTGDFLTWVTVITVAVFLTLMIVMAKWYRPTVSERGEAMVPPATAPAEQPAQPEEGAVPLEPAEGSYAPVESVTETNSVDQ